MKNYYTAFVYGDPEPNLSLGHCTHKYLGPLRCVSVETIRMICTDYFGGTAKAFPKAVFNMPDYFGTDHSVRVLRPDAPIIPGAWFPTLRHCLNSYRIDEFIFSPHVANAKQDRIFAPFSGYALVNATDKIIEGYWINRG